MTDGTTRDLRALVSDLADRVMFLEAEKVERTGQPIDGAGKVLLGRAWDLGGWRMHARAADERFLRLIGRGRLLAALRDG